MSRVTDDIKGLQKRLNKREFINPSSPEVAELLRLMRALSERVDDIAETNSLWDGS